MKKAQISTPLRDIMQLSEHSIIKALKMSFKHYKEAKQSSFSTRRKWLEELAEARSNQEAASLNKSTRPKKQSPVQSAHFNVAKHIRMILQVEHTQNMFRHIKGSVGKSRMSERVCMLLFGYFAIPVLKAGA